MTWRCRFAGELQRALPADFSPQPVCHAHADACWMTQPMRC